VSLPIVCCGRSDALATKRWKLRKAL